MDAVAVNAAKILLAKTIPDLRTLEHTGDPVRAPVAIMIPMKDG